MQADDEDLEGNEDFDAIVAAISGKALELVSMARHNFNLEDEDMRIAVFMAMRAETFIAVQSILETARKNPSVPNDVIKQSVFNIAKAGVNAFDQIEFLRRHSSHKIH